MKKQKTRDIKIRFTIEEYNEVWKRKEAHQLSFTNYARITMLGRQAARKFPSREMLAAILTELGKLSYSMHQIAELYINDPGSTPLTQKDFERVQHNILIVRDYIGKAVRHDP